MNAPFVGPRIPSQINYGYSMNVINYIFSNEHLFEFADGYNASRLLPTVTDWQNFSKLLNSVKKYQHVYVVKTLSIREKCQLFLIWLTDLDNGKNLSAVYYIALIASIEAKNTSFHDEKPFDYRRFVQR